MRRENTPTATSVITGPIRAFIGNPSAMFAGMGVLFGILVSGFVPIVGAIAPFVLAIFAIPMISTIIRGWRNGHKITVKESWELSKGSFLRYFGYSALVLGLSAVAAGLAIIIAVMLTSYGSSSGVVITVGIIVLLALLAFWWWSVMVIGGAAAGMKKPLSAPGSIPVLRSAAGLVLATIFYVGITVLVSSVIIAGIGYLFAGGFEMQDLGNLDELTESQMVAFVISIAVYLLIFLGIAQFTSGMFLTGITCLFEPEDCGPTDPSTLPTHDPSGAPIQRVAVRNLGPSGPRGITA